MLCLCCLFVTRAASTQAAPQATPRCDLIWLPGAPFPGPSDRTLALLPLPSGHLIAGGEFLYADSSDVQHLARWDGADWLPFASGGGANGDVACLLRAPNGDIYAGGEFTSIGGVAANRIARYDGTQWHALGSGLDGRVRDLCLTSTGLLVAGGDFLTGGGQQLRHVARWDGQVWASYSGGVTNGFRTVSYVAEHGNGDIVIGGDFVFVDGLAAAGLARWDGTAWTGCGTPANATIRGMARQPNGNIAVMLKSSGTHLAIWDGSSLQTQSTLVAGLTTSMAVASNGDLLVGGAFTPPGLSLQRLARFDGTTWAATDLPAPTGVETIAVAATGDAFVGGRNTGQFAPSNVSRWDGVGWTSIGADAVSPSISSYQRMPNGDLIACGEFTSIGGVTVNNIARFDGTSWSAMGSGLNDSAYKLALAGQDLIVVGAFTQAGGQPANHIARWDGLGWSALGSGLSEAPWGVAGQADGQVYVGRVGSAGAVAGPLVLWNGAAWQSVPTTGPGPGPGTAIYDMDVMPDGTLVVSSAPQSFGGPGLIRTWDGAGWQILGSPIGQGAPEVVASPDGSVYALTAPGGVQRWDGTSWHVFGGYILTAFARLPSGQVIAAGDFGGVIGRGVARWTGVSWEAVATTGGQLISAIGVSGYGDLFLSGGFDTANEEVANGFVRGITPCPATTTPFATGCAGSNGLVTLTTNDRAWVGSSVVLTTAGVSTNSIVVQVLGFREATVPLPFGATGCTLDVSPDVLELLLPSAGQASINLQFPPDPNLAGILIPAQGVVLELGSGLSIQQSASSNGLRLQVGAM